ncbi:hypothetical protein OnM2_064076 [Erysiphe neolycopersici]|uniref:Uncharacterized protein n=1 Tax=Erysiphe neolycopersici TaxID=212602 RepID=A0A420HN38_9PEZI|nr:hypothetical protein OnM2_064076 [Erysiphe neolycopersici]
MYSSLSFPKDLFLKMPKFTRNSKSSDFKKSYLLKLKYSRNQKSKKITEKSSTYPVKIATSALKKIFCCRSSQVADIPPSQDFFCPSPQDLVREDNTSFWRISMANDSQSNNYYYPSIQNLSLYQMKGLCLQPITEPASTPKPKSRTRRVRIDENQMVVINNYF